MKKYCMLALLAGFFTASHAEFNSLKTPKRYTNLRALAAKIFEESKNEKIQKFVEKNKDADGAKSIKEILIGAADDSSKLTAAALNALKINLNNMNDNDLNTRFEVSKMYMNMRPDTEEIVEKLEVFLDEVEKMAEAQENN